jgi:hypothetical protein
MFTVVAVAIAVSLGAQDQERMLDLTRGPESSRPSIAPRNVQNCRSGGRGAGQSGGIPPFALTVEGFDKPEYRMGEAIVIDLKLTNTSNQTLPIPVVLADQYYEPFEGEESIQFGLTILVKDASGEEHELTGTLLRGSTKYSDTTQSLARGESIKIHFPGHSLVTDSVSAPVSREGQLMASLLITDGECRMWDVVRSTAVGTVRVRNR